MVRTRRKLYVFEEPLKKVPDPSQVTGHSDPSQVTGHSDPSQVTGINNKTLNKELINNKQEKIVVVPSSPLDLLNLPQDYKLRQISKHSSEKIELLVRFVRVWESRRGDMIACNTILKQWDTWSGSVANDKRHGQTTDDQQQLIDSRKKRAEIIKNKFNLSLDIKTDRIEVIKFSKSGKRSFTSIGFLDDDIEKILKKYE